MNKDNLCVGISTIECQVFHTPVILSLSKPTALKKKMLHVHFIINLKLYIYITDTLFVWYVSQTIFESLNKNK